MRFPLIVLFIFLSFNSYSQFSLSGVVSSKEDVLLGAEVQLYKMNSDFTFGILTDDQGKFNVDGLEKGRYKITINYLGFKNYRSRFDLDIDLVLDPIIMEEDVIEIDGVEITGSMIQAI